MGCASSSPLVNGGGGPGGLADTAKNAANDVMTTGENAMNGKYYKHFFHDEWHNLNKRQRNMKILIQLLRKIDTHEGESLTLQNYRVKFNFPQNNHRLLNTTKYA